MDFRTAVHPIDMGRVNKWCPILRILSISATALEVAMSSSLRSPARPLLQGRWLAVPHHLSMSLCAFDFQPHFLAVLTLYHLHHGS